METAETTVTTVPDTYNPNLLVTYKVIKGYSDAEYATDKVTSIEKPTILTTMKKFTFTDKKDTRSGFGAGLSELGKKK